MGAVLGLAAAVGWGVADFFGAKGARVLPPGLTAFAVQAIGCLAFACLLAATGTDLGAVPAAAAGHAAAAGIVMAIGQLLFYRALRAGPLCIVSPLSSAYPLFTTALTVALGGGLSLRDGSGIVAVVGGVALASGIRTPVPGAPRVAAGPRLSVGAAIAWGASFLLVGEAVHETSWQAATLVELSCASVTFAVLLPLAGAAPRPGELRAVLGSRAVWLAALIQQTAEAMFNLGLAHSRSIAVVTAISACYPAITVVLALRGLHERVDAGACPAPR
jgi:drug/metabolite transporter (DMT)-like permease